MKLSSGTVGRGGFFLLPVGDEDLVGAFGLLGCLAFLVAALLAAAMRAGCGCRAGMGIRR